MSDELTAVSCGVFIMRRTQSGAEFLLMTHADRLDFPKGHVEKGEMELECALRELKEETGIRRKQVRLDPNFRYENTYSARYKRFEFRPVRKTLVLFLGWVDGDVTPVASEHVSFAWYEWNPPHSIQEQAIDPFLSYVYNYIEAGGGLDSVSFLARRKRGS
jgi:bis(5'-nucleosidyl)-tetraphosphatase